MGIFLAGYGVMRFFIEFYREPDSHLGYAHLGTFTRGQLLCFLMILIGVALLVLRRNKMLPPDPSESDSGASPA